MWARVEMVNTQDQSNALCVVYAIFVCWHCWHEDQSMQCIELTLVFVAFTQHYMCMFLEKGRFCDGKYVHFQLCPWYKYFGLKCYFNLSFCYFYCINLFFQVSIEFVKSFLKDIAHIFSIFWGKILLGWKICDRK